MTDDPLFAHSLAEAKLYLLATPCPSCDRGPTRCVGQVGDESQTDRPVVRLTARCGSCAHERTLDFLIAEYIPVPSFDLSKVINPTEDPSRIIDLAQWLTLATMLTESAKQESDKVVARQLRCEAGLCVDEALKFYDDRNNDLPPPGAFFNDVSRTLFRQQPERFARQRLQALRLDLPAPHDS